MPDKNHKNAHCIARLRMEGYKGSDASLEISLQEYGFVWKQYGRTIGTYNKGDWKFIYAVKWNDTGDATDFDWAWVQKDVDYKVEWSWLFGNENNTKSLYETEGTTEDDFAKLPLPAKVEAMIRRFGYENIFGTAYSSFKIGGLKNG